MLLVVMFEIPTGLLKVISMCVQVLDKGKFFTHT